VIRARCDSQARQTMHRRTATGGVIVLLKGRVKAAQRDRFRPSTLNNAPTPALADPFSPATPAIRFRSAEPGRRRRA